MLLRTGSKREALAGVCWIYWMAVRMRLGQNYRSAVQTRAKRRVGRRVAGQGGVYHHRHCWKVGGARPGGGRA